MLKIEKVKHKENVESKVKIKCRQYNGLCNNHFSMLKIENIRQEENVVNLMVCAIIILAR